MAVDNNNFPQHADYDYSDFASVSLRYGYDRLMRGTDGRVCSVHADSGNLPQFNRKLAEQWSKCLQRNLLIDLNFMAAVYYQSHFIRRVKMSIHHLGEQDGDLFTRQPFQVTWFASQVAM